MRLFIVKLLAVAMLVIVGWSEARADALLDKFGAQIPDSAVQATMTLALKNIQDARCQQDKLCAPATPKELKQPPITIAEGRVAMAQGIVSAFAEHCGLDWKTRSFLPMADYRRDQLKMGERAMALIALMHSISQSHQLAAFKDAKLGPCSDALRAQLDASLPKP